MLKLGLDPARVQPLYIHIWPILGHQPPLLVDSQEDLEVESDSHARCGPRNQAYTEPDEKSGPRCNLEKEREFLLKTSILPQLFT